VASVQIAASDENETLYAEAGVQIATSDEKTIYTWRMVFKQPLAIEKVKDCTLRLVLKLPGAMKSKRLCVEACVQTATSDEKKNYTPRLMFKLPLAMKNYKTVC